MSSLKERFVRFRRWLRGDDVFSGWDKNRSANRLLSILSGRDSLFEERWTTPVVVIILLILAIALPFYYFKLYGGLESVDVVQKQKDLALSLQQDIKNYGSQWRQEMLAQGKNQYAIKVMASCLERSQECNKFAFALDQLASSSALQSTIFNSIGHCLVTPEKCGLIIKLFASENFPRELYLSLAEIYFPVCFQERKFKEDCYILFDLVAKKFDQTEGEKFSKRCQAGELIWCPVATLAYKNNTNRSLFEAALIQSDKAIDDLTFKTVNGIQLFREVVNPGIVTRP